MQTTRARFKYALRYCKSVENRARADALAKKLLLKDNKHFWKDFKSMSDNNINVLSNVVDNCTGEDKIAEMCHNFY